MDTVHECDRQTDRRRDRITITKTTVKTELFLKVDNFATTGGKKVSGVSKFSMPVH